MPRRRRLSSVVDGLDSTRGIVAVAAAGAALMALIVAFVAVRVAPPGAASGGARRRGRADLVGHAAELRRGSRLARPLAETRPQLNERIDDGERRMAGTVSRAAVIRYDAFNETSGQQSSSVALFDDHGNGVVLSAILQREQARIYAKPRASAAAASSTLSPEEQEAIRGADGAAPATREGRLPGPAGTFNEDALLAAAAATRARARSAGATIFDAISRSRAATPSAPSCRSRTRSRARSARRSTRSPSTPPACAIVGEHDHPIRHSLIARTELALERDRGRLSHPQANAQCARFVREQLPGAEVRAVASTADAVRQVARAPTPWAALGAAAAARALRLRDPARRASRTSPTTSPASSGSRPRRPSPTRVRARPGGRRSSSPSSAPTTRALSSRR